MFVKMPLKPMSSSSSALTQGGLNSMHIVSEKGSAPHGWERADYLRPIQIPRPTRMWVWVALIALGLFADVRVAHAAVAYVQSNSASPNNSSLSTLSVTFSAAQTAGDFNAVAVGWGSGSAISSITDSKGNSYTLAVGPTTISGGSAAIYYAKNIAAASAGANIVTVTFSTGVPFPDVRVAEYSGINTTSPLDVTAVSTGTGTLSNSGSATTTNANDLLIGSNWVLSGTTGAGTGYTQRQISGWDGDILEDEIVSAVGAYSATAPISPSAAWIMQMAAFKGAGTGGDTTPPSAPSALTATSVTSTLVNLSWTAATDNVGVTGYRVERCAGAGCANFLQIGTSTGTTYGDVDLTASSTYLYRVRATDAAGNLGGYSNTLTTLTTAAPGAITYKQSNSASPNNSSLSTLSVTFSAAQTAGDFNAVAVGWGSGSAISSITDSKGNSYTLAVGPTTISGGSAAIYYAKNIAAASAGANIVTVTFSTGVPFPDVRVAEYSGINTTSPLDVTAVSTGTGTLSNSGSATTTNANDLLIGSNWVLSGTTGAGTGYTQRQISGWDGDILEDEIVSAVGAYSATAPISPSAAWIMQMAAFKGAGTGGDTTPPSAPSALTATSVTSTLVNLSWTAATDNVGVTGYLVERCAGAGCTSFLQIGTSTGTTYGDVDLTASSTYLYRVRATDAAGNLGAYSNTLTTTTSAGGGGDTQPPTAPTLSILAASSTEIDLTWSGSTDNVGVTGYFIERCSGASCSGFIQIATPSAAPFYDPVLSPATAYSYRVRASDAAGNLSPYSNVVSMSTPASSPDCN